MAEGISKYHGEISECSCGLYRFPEKQTERACRVCMGRGFVASCLACDGKGMLLQKMAGGPGTHTATCSMCGGTACFGVNKPADWEETHPKELPQEQEAAVA
jgi:hypothetical protein